jgi:peptidoglycan/LPS O-acetylase OafA/YrhL
MVTIAAESVSSVSTEKKRVPKLEGIRGFCALGVVLTHVAVISGLIGGFDGPPTNWLAATVMSGLTVCLGPFFILSGLLLYRPFARATLANRPRPPLGSFFVRRALRLLPAYYLLTVICLLALNFDSIKSLWYVLRPIVLMQNYDAVYMSGMDPTWSVPTEMQFYLALPLLGWLMHRLGRSGKTLNQSVRRMLIPPAVMFLLNFPWILYLHWGFLGEYPAEYFWPFAQLGVFAIGMAMAVLSARTELEPARVPALYRAAINHPNAFWYAAFVLFVINCLAPFGKIASFDFPKAPAAIAQLVLFLGFGFLVVVPLTVPGASSKFQEALLGNPVVRFLGRISYGIYLWHFAIANFWFLNGNLFGSEPLPILAFRGRTGFLELALVVVLGSILMATLSYYLVERPALRLSDWLTGRRKTVALEAAATLVVPAAGAIPRSTYESVPASSARGVPPAS